MQEERLAGRGGTAEVTEEEISSPGAGARGHELLPADKEEHMASLESSELPWCPKASAHKKRIQDLRASEAELRQGYMSVQEAGDGGIETREFIPGADKGMEGVGGKRKKNQMKWKRRGNL